MLCHIFCFAVLTEMVLAKAPSLEVVKESVAFNLPTSESDVTIQWPDSTLSMQDVAKFQTTTDSVLQKATADITKTQSSIQSMNSSLMSLDASLNNSESRADTLNGTLISLARRVLAAEDSCTTASQLDMKLDALFDRLQANLSASASRLQSPTVYESCQQVLQFHPSAASAIYWIRFQAGEAAHPIKCIFDDGVAWTLASRIDSQGTQWHVTDNSHAGEGNQWESTSTFGNVSASEGDYKSAAYSQCAAASARVYWNGLLAAETVPFGQEGCTAFSTSPTPLAFRFQSLEFRCESATLKPPATCANACQKKPLDYAATDGLFNGSHVLFQAGEVASRDPTNNDRVYLSGNLRTIHQPAGLGVYCAGLCSNAPGTANVGSAGQDGVIPPLGRHVYEIYVKCSSPSPPTYHSCQEVLDVNPAAPSGLYTIKYSGTSPRTVFCRMEGLLGWALAARITATGTQWQVSDTSHAGSSNNWENSAVFGQPDVVTEDYKSYAYTSAPMSRLRVEYRGVEVAETTDFGAYGCHAFAPTRVSLMRRFQEVAFRCKAESFDVSPPPECSNFCRILPKTYGPDPIGIIGSSEYLLFQSGEMANFNPTNNDRTYLVGSVKTNIHAPGGMGAFCAGSGCTKNSGTANLGKMVVDGVEPVDVDGAYYELYVA
eukprot:m.150200 g.150200  ORF g.150200 m.150200 type:complete len:659 (+) comp16312_c0_seq1:2702-4678(+)